MISLHPDVSGNFNETLATAARHVMSCAAMCTSCADACSAEQMDVRQCIRSCLDCADVCDAKLAVRRTGQNLTGLRADECSRHNHVHCTLGAEMFGDGARDCQVAIPTLQ
jgi:hypothetical protein